MIISEIPQNIKSQSSKKSKAKEPTARLVYSVGNQNFYTSDFIGKPIILNKKSKVYLVREKQKKYELKTYPKGSNLGSIYLLSIGKDGGWWVSLRVKKGEFLHIPAENIIDLNYIKKYSIKTKEQQEKDLEKKLKEAESRTPFSFGKDLLTKALLIGGGILLLKK